MLGSHFGIVFIKLAALAAKRSTKKFEVSKFYNIHYWNNVFRVDILSLYAQKYLIILRSYRNEWHKCFHRAEYNLLSKMSSTSVRCTIRLYISLIIRYMYYLWNKGRRSAKHVLHQTALMKHSASYNLKKFKNLHLTSTFSLIEKLLLDLLQFVAPEIVYDN